LTNAENSLFRLPKVVRQQFIGVFRKFLTFQCPVSSRCCLS